MGTGKELAAYAISKIGMPYFYGAKMVYGALTEAFMKQMHTSYPSIVTNSYMTKARGKGQVGKINVDCSGLIGGYRKVNIGSAQLYQQAYTRMPISKVNDFAIGTVLWKSGHVGVYIGDGYVVEAKGINYGVIKSKVASTKWVYGLTFSDISYDYNVKVPGTWRGSNPYSVPGTLVTSKVNAKSRGTRNYISEGEQVKWVQFELVESGYDLKIDGDCGKNTLDAIKDFQRSCKIKADGIVGPTTIKYLQSK